MLKQVVTDVFFDLDHTLWDFEKNSALTFEDIFKKHDISLSIQDFLEVYVPINFNYWKLYREDKISKEKLRYYRLKDTFNALRYELNDALIFDLSEDYIKHLPLHGNLFANTIEILSYLKPKYKLHIITNGFKEVQHAKLQSSNIQDFFIHVINSEEVGVKKPNPLIFEYALNKAQVHPHKSIMIGDNLEADILGAKNMGLHVLHFNSNNEEKHNHAEIINNLIEIKRYL